MRISTQGLSLWYERPASERELRQRLGRLDVAATAQLEDPSGYPTEFYLLHVQQAGSTLAVGLGCTGQSIAPQVHVADGESILLGFASQVVRLRVEDGQQLWQVELGALFRELIELRELNLLLVIHELGAACLSHEGEVLWRFDKDLVEHFAIKRESLILRFATAPGVRLDLRTGERW